MSSADNICKQFGPRSSLTKCRAWSESKLFDTLMVFLKEFFKWFDIEKKQQTTKKHAKFPSRQRVNSFPASGPTSCLMKIFETVCVSVYCHFELFFHFSTQLSRLNMSIWHVFLIKSDFYLLVLVDDLHPRQQFFSHASTFLELNQYLADN